MYMKEKLVIKLSSINGTGLGGGGEGTLKA